MFAQALHHWVLHPVHLVEGVSARVMVFVPISTHVSVTQAGQDLIVRSPTQALLMACGAPGQLGQDALTPAVPLVCAVEDVIVITPRRAAVAHLVVVPTHSSPPATGTHVLFL